MDSDISTTTWADLPADLVSAIAGRLPAAADLARFRSVCPSWRSASAAHAARRRVPLLLLPSGEGRDRATPRVWSLAGGRFREPGVPVPPGRGVSHLYASHHGWALAVADGDLSATLVHPFAAGATADLPPLSAASFRDESWTPIGCSAAARVTGVTYCGGAFYLLEGSTCKVTAVDAETLAAAAVIEPPPAVVPGPRCLVNLAVSPPGELLLLVRKLLLESGFNAWQVKVFRANRAAGDRSPGWSWSEVAGGVGDRAVFVDHLRAFCVEASALNGLRGNCVYDARSCEELHDDYGMDVTVEHTVDVLDIADVTTLDVSLRKLVSLCPNRFWQWPSWSLPNLH
ncbi:hypothetical protein ACP4OV_028829 [Aristida adscensionis]